MHFRNWIRSGAIRRLVVLCSLLGTLPPAHAEAEKPVTWKECVETTARNNAQIIAAREALFASQYTARGTFSGFLPQLVASGSYLAQAIDNTSRSQSYTTSVTVSENVFNGWGDRARIDQAAANARAAEALLDQSKASASQGLKYAYAGLVYAVRSVKLQESIIRRREENLRLVELRYESGSENKGSLLLSRANMEEARFEELQARNAVRTAQAELKRWMGRDDEGELRVADDLPEGSVPTPKPDMKTLAVASPLYRQSVAQEDAANASVAIARSQFLPSVNLSATASDFGPNWYPQQDRWSMGVTVSLNLFNGGRDYYAAKSASASTASAASTASDLSRLLISQLENTFTKYLEITDKLNVDGSFLKAALARADIARAKYNSGLLLFDNWDIIEDDLISRQKTVLATWKSKVQAEADWEAAQGRGVLP